MIKIWLTLIKICKANFLWVVNYHKNNFKNCTNNKKGQCFTLFKVFKSAHVKNNITACILLNRLFLLNYVYKNDKKDQYLHNLKKKLY